MNQYAVIGLSTLFGETRVTWTDSQRSGSEIGAEGRRKQILSETPELSMSGELVVVIHNEPKMIDVQPGDTIRDRSNGATVEIEDVTRTEQGFPTIMGHTPQGTAYVRTIMSVTEYDPITPDRRSLTELLASLDVATDSERNAAKLWPRSELRIKVGRAPKKLAHYSTGYERDVWMRVYNLSEDLTEDIETLLQHTKRGAPLATRNGIQARIDATVAKLLLTVDAYRAQRSAAGTLPEGVEKVNDVDEEED